MKKLLTIMAVLALATMSLASVTVFEGEQKDVDFKVKVGGYFQFRWDYDLNNAEGNEAEGEGNLKVKRAKISFKGDIGDYWSFKVVDYVSKPELEEMVLTFQPADLFWIDFGLLKPAGSYLHKYSSSKQPFVDRPAHDGWMPSFSEGMALNFKYENYIHLAIGVWDNDNLEAFETTGGGTDALSDMDLTVWANSKFMKGLNLGGFFYMGNDRSVEGLDDVFIPVMAYGAHANYTWDYIYAGVQYVGGSWNISEAVDMTAKYGDKAAILSGGTDLMIMLQNGSASPEHVIALGEIDDMDYIKYSKSDGLRIGALATISQIIENPTVKKNYPALWQACKVHSAPQIRNVATPLGNIMRASPSGDCSCALLALGAAIVLEGTSGKREVPLDDFFIDYAKTARKADEIAVEIKVPPAKDGIV